MTQNIGTDGQSFQGYAGLVEEASSYAAGGSPSTFIPIRTDGFGLENSPLFDSNVRGRDRFLASAGAFTDDGSLELVAGPENGLGVLLKGAFGSASVTTSSEGSGTDNVGTHTFSTDDKLPSYAVEIGLGAIEAARHLGVGIDVLEFSHTPEDYLIITADMIASRPELQGSQASPSYSDLRPFVWHDGVITFDSDDRTTDVAEFTCTITNNLDPKMRGERYATKMHVGERPISGTLNLDFENTDALEMFLGDDPANDPTTVQDTLYKASLNAKWTSPELVVSGGTSGYELELDIPSIALATWEGQLNEQEAIIENVPWEAEVDSAGTGYDIEATLTNGQTSAY